MNLWFTICAGALFVLSGLAPAGAAAGRSVHIDDPAGLLPDDPAAVRGLEQKLADFEHRDDVRVLVRLHPHAPAPEDDAQPGAFMRSLAGTLDVGQRGVLAVYFADEDEWRIWVGDDLAVTFARRSGTVVELTANRAIHEAKEAFFAAARAAGEAAVVAARQSAASDRAPTAADRLALHAHAIVDGLIARLGAHASTKTSNPP